MSRTKRFIGGVGYGYVNQFLVTLAGLWLMPFLLAHVGQRNYGLWLVGTQVVAYLMLLDFGIVALVPRETAFASGRMRLTGERDEIPLLVGETIRMVLWQTPLAAAAAVAFWFLMPAEWEPLHEPLALVLLAFVVMFPLRIFPAVLQGLQDLKFAGKAQLCVWLLSTACTVALVYAGFGLYALAAGWVVLQVSGALVSLFRLRRHFPRAWPKHLPALTWPAARTKLTQGFWVSISQVSMLLMYGTDILVIGAVFGAAAVVPYVCTAKLASVLANQPQMLLHVAGPALSEIKVSESRARAVEVSITLGQAVLLVSGGIICVVLAVNEGFVGWWVGADNYGGFALTALVLINMLLRHWSFTLAYSVFFLGHDRYMSVTSLLDGVVTACSVAVFVWAFGVVGAPLGSIVAVTAVSLPRSLRMLARESGKSAWEVAAPLLTWWWRFLLLAAATGASAQVWTPKTAPALAATTLVVAAGYALMMSPLLARAPLRLYLPARMGELLLRLFGGPSPSKAV